MALSSSDKKEIESIVRKEALIELTQSEQY